MCMLDALSSFQMLRLYGAGHRWMNVHGALVEWYWQEKNWSTWMETLLQGYFVHIKYRMDSPQSDPSFCGERTEFYRPKNDTILFSRR